VHLPNEDKPDVAGSECPTPTPSAPPSAPPSASQTPASHSLHKRPSWSDLEPGGAAWTLTPTPSGEAFSRHTSSTSLTSSQGQWGVSGVASSDAKLLGQVCQACRTAVKHAASTLSDLSLTQTLGVGDSEQDAIGRLLQESYVLLKLEDFGTYAGCSPRAPEHCWAFASPSLCPVETVPTDGLALMTHGLALMQACSALLTQPYGRSESTVGHVLLMHLPPQKHWSRPHTLQHKAHACAFSAEYWLDRGGKVLSRPPVQPHTSSYSSYSSYSSDSDAQGASAQHDLHTDGEQWHLAILAVRKCRLYAGNSRDVQREVASLLKLFRASDPGLPSLRHDVAAPSSPPSPAPPTPPCSWTWGGGTESQGAHFTLKLVHGGDESGSVHQALVRTLERIEGVSQVVAGDLLQRVSQGHTGHVLWSLSSLPPIPPAFARTQRVGLDLSRWARLGLDAPLHASLEAFVDGGGTGAGGRGGRKEECAMVLSRLVRLHANVLSDFEFEEALDLMRLVSLVSQDDASHDASQPPDTCTCHHTVTASFIHTDTRGQRERDAYTRHPYESKGHPMPQVPQRNLCAHCKEEEEDKATGDVPSEMERSHDCEARRGQDSEKDKGHDTSVHACILAALGAVMLAVDARTLTGDARTLTGQVAIHLSAYTPACIYTCMPPCNTPACHLAIHLHATLQYTCMAPCNTPACHLAACQLAACQVAACQVAACQVAIHGACQVAIGGVCQLANLPTCQLANLPTCHRFGRHSNGKRPGTYLIFRR